MGEYGDAFREGGLKKFNELVEDKTAVSRNAFSMWRFAQWASGLPEYAKEMQRVEEKLEKDGVGPAIREIMGKLGIEVEANVNPEWLSTQGSPVLLYGNHAARLEPWLLATLLDRNDVACVGGRMMQKAGPNIESHILPVIPKKYAKGGGRRTIVEKTVFGDGDLDVDEATKLNQASMQEAGKRLGDGWLVGIFPTATEAIDSKWRKGLGEIIKNTPQNSEVRLVPTHFGDLKYREILKSIRRVYGKGKEPKHRIVDINFGEELRLSDLPPNMSAEEITQFLKQDYLKKFS